MFRYLAKLQNHTFLLVCCLFSRLLSATEDPFLPSLGQEGGPKLPILSIYKLVLSLLPGQRAHLSFFWGLDEAEVEGWEG